MGDHVEENYETNGYDISVIYDYKEYPDVKFGRCDNCDYALFKSSVKSGYASVVGVV